MTIREIPVQQLAIIIAGLVAQGVTFEAYPSHFNSDTYTIKLTGGY